jgi:hypothetical protein
MASFFVREDLLMSLVSESGPQEEVHTEPKVLLPWNEDGLLPFRHITMTSQEVLDSPFVTGLGAKASGWDQRQRYDIAKELESCARTLSFVGITEIIVGGEFVEEIADPESIQGFFRFDGDKLPLSLLDDYLRSANSTKHWPWLTGNSRKRPALVNLFPVPCYRRETVIEVLPLPLEHFYKDSDGREKGVVRLIER